MSTSLNLISGINQLGYGIVGLNLLKAAVAAEQETALWSIGPVDCPVEDQELVTKAVNQTAIYDPSLPCLRVWHQFDMAQFVGRGPRLGYSFFELDRLRPVEKHHLSKLDVVLAPSQWAADVMRAEGVERSGATIRLARPGVDASIFHSDVPKANLKQAGPQTTIFLNSGKWEIRKGHDVLLQIFNAAFEPTDDVLLVMNCFNPILHSEKSVEWQRHYQRSKLGMAGKILVLSERLPTQKHLASLMAAADCGVFPARAEGWNLEAAEMLAMGKNVILTDYAAHTEYARDAGALLLPVTTMEPAYDGVFFHNEGYWAHLGDNLFDVAVAYLRDVHRWKQQGGGCARNEAGIRLFRETFTWNNTLREVLHGL